MAAYYTALVLTLLGAFWLIPGARHQVLALALWLGVSVLCDLAKAYEMKLFVDVFGFFGIAYLTISQATKGKFTHGKNICAALGFAQVGISAIGYGVSYGFAGFYLPYESFSVLMNTHGVALNACFFLSGLALFIGEGGVRERAFDTVRSLGRVRLRRARILAPQKAFSAGNYLSERKT